MIIKCQLDRCFLLSTSTSTLFAFSVKDIVFPHLPLCLGEKVFVEIIVTPGHLGPCSKHIYLTNRHGLGNSRDIFHLMRCSSLSLFQTRLTGTKTAISGV